MTREELIDQHVCVACQKVPSMEYSVWCRKCSREISNADWRASHDIMRTVRSEEVRARRAP